MKINSIRKFVLMAAGAVFAATGFAAHLVLLHTNDTHSNIDPDLLGRGGVLQRKAIIDSVKKVEKNVIVIDAGDVVQGSLYFKFFRGAVEYPLLNMMGYDIRILGNHEFDNGLDELAKYYKDVKGDRLSANYDFSGTKADGLFTSYVIKKVGGKKIGFFGLNVNPESLIREDNYTGMRFKPIVETANKTAAELKAKGCDLVVAVTHIGYGPDSGRETDIDLAKASKDIDIIIGGHSHTRIDPANPGSVSCYVDNANGRPVLVTQTGKNGQAIGKIDIDLDDLDEEPEEKFDYGLIMVTDRFPEHKLDKKMTKYLEPFRNVVDSVNNHVIAYSAYDMPSNKRNGALANFTADLAFDYGLHVADSLQSAGMDFPKIDFAVINVGGIRQDMHVGKITEGEVLSRYPFSNYMVIMQEKGADVIEALTVAAKKGGEAISRNLRVLTDEKGNLLKVLLNGYEIVPEKDYVMITIDYLAEGNDDMTAFARGKRLWIDNKEMSAPVLDYIIKMGERGMNVNPDCNGRFIKVEPLQK